LHAGPIEQNEAFEMVAVCDIDPKRQEEARGRFACAVYKNYHEMLDKEELDLVVIVTRSDQHCRMTCDCLAAGVDVLVTKPWAVNAAEAEQMVAAEEASGKRLLPWLPARWGCDLKRLKELMAEQAIGDVFLVRRAVASFGTRCDWQTERRYGGGYLLNWGPHLVDPPVVLLRSEVKSVYGRMKQTVNPGDGEDVFFGVLNLDNGAVVQVEYTVSAEPLPNWFIQGTGGTIVVNGNDFKIIRKTPARPDDPTQYAATQSEGEGESEEHVEGNVYGDEYEIYAEIAEALAGDGAYPVAPTDALELSRVLDAIRTASEEDRVVTL
jgi:predicted dehydrogenase